MDFPSNFAPLNRDQYIDWRTGQLLNTDAYDPASVDMMVEALYLAANSYEEMELLREYFDKKEFEKLGRLIWCWSFDYAEAAATHKAEQEYDNNQTDPWI